MTNKQMWQENQNIAGEMLVLINQGELCINEAERIKAWIEHYTGQLNVAFPWNESSLPKAPPAVGPTRPITDKMTKVALD